MDVIRDDRESQDSSYRATALDTNYTMAKFLSSEGDFRDSLLVPKFGQHQTLTQENDSRLVFLPRGWDFPANDHDYGMPSFDMCMENDKDGALSQIGAWSRSSKEKIGLHWSEDDKELSRSDLLERPPAPGTLPRMGHDVRVSSAHKFRRS